MEQLVFANVEKGSTICTDENRAYAGLRRNYTHRAINHGREEYSRNGITTNAVESVFAVMRRGLHGVYHKASKKHLGRYVNEFAWRLNEGSVANHTLDRLNSLVAAVSGRQITYKELIASNGKDPITQEF